MASSLVVMVGLAQISSVDYSLSNNRSLPIAISPSSPFNNGTLVTGQDSRTIFTSSVPETIAHGINNLLTNLSSSLLAYPMTLSLANVNGNFPLVVRGLPLQIIQKTLSSSGVSRLNAAGNWTLLGSQAAKEINAHVGTVLSISCPLSSTNSPFKVSVAGIYSLGDEADYEALVPLTLGQEIGGLSGGAVNAVVVPSKNVEGLNLDSLVKQAYLLKLEYSGIPGTIEVVDSSGYMHDVLSASSNSSFVQRTFNFSIPFGSYTLVLDQSGIRTTLSQFTPSKNDTTLVASSNVQTGSGESFLYVKNDTGSANQIPKLVNPQNQTIVPKSYNQTTNNWIFLVKNGLYTLVLPSGANAAKILIVGNATYDPGSNFSNLNSNLNILISSLSSGYGNSFSVTVKDAYTSQVVFSIVGSSGTSLSVPVESNHTYTVSVLSLSTNILLQKNISISEAIENATFTFPLIPFISSSVPVSDYSSLGLGVPSKTGYLSFLLGGAVSSVIALFAIVFVLLGLALIALSRQLIISLRKEIKALNFVFPSRPSIRSRIKLPMFLFLLGAVLGAFLISFGVFQFFDFSSSVTFLGYGIEEYPLVFILPVIIALALVSYLKISISMDSEIFGARSRN